MNRSDTVYPTRLRKRANGDLLNDHPTKGGGISGSRFKGKLVQALANGSFSLGDGGASRLILVHDQGVHGGPSDHARTMFEYEFRNATFALDRES